ncbi:MAG: peptide-methionine (S)-S-oxide reductase MsrA [Candidatus Lokiarchaeota archaeon]|nr:peptide-methionine (S)-S-oxide reductase MsrA [Candidatus Lokiarchaeota archaeon]
MEEKATFGGGCFWGVEARFREYKGVLFTRVGYTGGRTDKPTYKEVCTDKTGHAEAVEITYNPDLISYEDLLNIFFEVHDPTQVNRQGVDIGTQYRSVIFYHNEKQKKKAEEIIKRLTESEAFKKPIATQLVPATTFWEAEDYHQRYYEKQGKVSCLFTLKR